MLAGQSVADVRDAVGDFSMDRYTSTNAVNRVDEGAESAMLPAEVRPFRAWYAAHFPGLERIPIRVICWRSIFAVHRRHIQQHALAHYRRFLAQLETHPNPEVGHFIERSWGAIFFPYPPQCVRSGFGSAKSRPSSSYIVRSLFLL